MTPTPYNEHIRLAQAMLHGHLYIDPAPAYMEHINVNGHSYILHGPLSAFLCLPFVAVGITDQRLICCVLGALSALLCYRLTRSGWLTAFFVCGTTFLYECSNGASWDFALVATTPFTLLALIYADGCVGEEHRGCPVARPHSSAFLCGLFAGLAALARYDLALAWPAYLWMIWRRENDSVVHQRHNYWWLRALWPSRAIRRLLYGMALSVGAAIWFNEARFGTLTDNSVSEWYWHYDQFRAQRPYGPFSLHYLPFNLYTLLFMAPTYQGGFPWIRPQFMGQALLSLSPGFLICRSSVWLMAAMLCSIPALTVYASGFQSDGMSLLCPGLPVPYSDDGDRAIDK